MPISLSGSLNLSGSLTTTGTITATTLVVQTITSSISSITGSTNFGSLSSNTHIFTGSLNVTGALYVATGSVGIGTSSPNRPLEIVGNTPLRLNTQAFGGNTAIEFITNTTKFNFLIGAQYNISDAFEITPSTVVNGTTFSTPALVVKSSGNVGIGNTTPPNKLFIIGTGGIAGIVGWSDGVTGTGFLGQTTAGVTYVHSNNNALAFGANGSNNFAETMRITGGNVGIGTSSPYVIASPNTHVDIRSSLYSFLEVGTSSTVTATDVGYLEFMNGNNTRLATIVGGADGTALAGYMRFSTSNSSGSFTERMRITSGGDVLIGATSGTSHIITKAVSVGTSPILQIYGNNSGANFFNCDGNSSSAANTGMRIGQVGATGRSINAGGTINASGADYAEYMTKAIEDNIVKGDIVGVNENGLLTNIFADAKSFVVKSTNPSYVGADTWGIELKDEELEDARIKVDRIAFSGQVPCNVYDANVGDYIIPIDDNGIIKGQAITNPTFEQYQISVGKVWKIMEDGRAWIAVKIG